MAEIRINATGELKLYDSDDSNYVSFKSAGTVSSDVTWTLPSADGSSGQVLVLMVVVHYHGQQLVVLIRLLLMEIL